MENVNLIDLNELELERISGGQCDCESSGRGAAKAVKAYFTAIWDWSSSTSNHYNYPLLH